MNASVVAPEVARFVAQVREALDDLEPEVIEELTGGLAADLTDALAADPTDAPAAWSDPQAYADELRSAAGIPPRPATPVRGRRLDRAAFLAPWHSLIDDVTRWLNAQPRWPAVRDFLVALRPVWWLVRGWTVFVVITWGTFGVLPVSLLGALALLALMVLSVQFGRGVADRRGRFRRPVAVANVLAAILSPFLILNVAEDTHHASDPSYEVVSEVPEAGLYSGGQEVTNVLPYDSTGRLLDGVQLFDQAGRPLAVQPPQDDPNVYSADGGVEFVPWVTADGQERWNVFPLRQRAIDSTVPVPIPTPTDTIAPINPSPGATGTGTGTAPVSPPATTAGSASASPSAS